MDRQNNMQRNRRPDGQMREYNHNHFSGGRGRDNGGRRSLSRERDYNSRDYSNNASRYNRRSRSRSRERNKRGYEYDDYDYRRGGDYGPDDDSRDNYSSASSSTHRNDRYRGRNDDHRGGGGGGGFDRRDHNRERGGYSRGDNFSPNYHHPHQGRDRNDHEDDGDNYDSDSGLQYTSQMPTNKIIVRGLPPHITEADIGCELMQNNIKPVSIRLIRRWNTGASRGFAFVEFSTEEEATRWMDYKQGVLMLQDNYRAVMQYSNSRYSTGGGGGGGSSGANADNSDWYCSKCLVFNFKRRENCFKCGASREESEKGGDGWDEISQVLTKKIILRNLDVLTNEEGVLTVLQNVLPLEQVAKIAKILVCRDPLTNTSRGICYLFFDTLVDSMNVHNGLKGLQQPLTMDSREVGVSYCVDGTAANTESNEADGNGHQQQQHKADNRDRYGGGVSGTSGNGLNVHGGASGAGGGANTYKYTSVDVPKLAEYSAKLYATNAAEHEHYYKYYAQYYLAEIENGQFANLPTISQLGGGETANSGAAVAQSAMQRKQQQMGKKGSGGAAGRSHGSAGRHSDTTYGGDSYNVETPRVQVPNGKDGRKYPIPDISQYQFEETSGYYYDPSTGLYYDANSQYYYNSELSCYLYWDNENRTFQLAPTTTPASAKTASATVAAPEKEPQPTATPLNKDTEADERAPDKVKHAKKIVKDMEKWAKQLNQKKDWGGGALQLPVPVKEEHPLRQSSASSGNGACADVGFAILEKKEKLSLSLEPVIRNSPASTVAVSSATAAKLVAYDSDNEGGDDRDRTNEKDYVDFEKLTCLLCQRAFQSHEILAKHIKMSDLHKQNLAKYKLTKAASSEDNDQGLSYRDRAKERRLKYGEADPPPLSKTRERFQKEMEKQASAAALIAASSSVAKTPIGGGNVGNKLLQKMGWQEGMGLGRSNQGRTNIIEVESRAGGAGLGTKAAGPPFVGGDYKTYIKKMMKQRYEQIE